MEVILEPGWVSALTALVTFITMVLGLLIGHLFWSAREIDKFKTYAANTYAKKEELNHFCDRMERKLDRLYDLLQKKEAAH